MQRSNWREEIELDEGAGLATAVLGGLGKAAKVAYGVSKVAAPIAGGLLAGGGRLAGGTASGVGSVVGGALSGAGA